MEGGRQLRGGGVKVEIVPKGCISSDSPFHPPQDLRNTVSSSRRLPPVPPPPPFQDLCDKVSASQSHNLHKLLGFHHLACCALLLRSALTLFWLRLEATPGQVSVWPWTSVSVAITVGTADSVMGLR